jgi:hypothetical protein
VGLGGDLTEDHDHASLGASLAGNLGEGVLLEERVEDSIRDLVAKLVCGGRRSETGGEAKKDVRTPMSEWSALKQIGQRRKQGAKRTGVALVDGLRGEKEATLLKSRHCADYGRGYGARRKRNVRKMASEWHHPRIRNSGEMYGNHTPKA